MILQFSTISTEAMNKYPKKFRFMFNTQGKNSRVRQNQKLPLSKIGRVRKPDLYSVLEHAPNN